MARGNLVEGKRQTSVHLSEDVYQALRRVSFETEESQSVIIERALRKELGMNEQDQAK